MLSECILSDVRVAMGQIRRAQQLQAQTTRSFDAHLFDAIGRALDALERVEAALSEPDNAAASDAFLACACAVPCCKLPASDEEGMCPNHHGITMAQLKAKLEAQPPLTVEELLQLQG